MKKIFIVTLLLSLIFITHAQAENLTQGSDTLNYQKAIENSSSSYCSKIKNDQYVKDLCYKRIAEATVQPKLCKKIKTQATKDSCNALMAEITGDFAYCKGLDHRYDACYEAEKKLNTSSYVNFDIVGTTKVLKKSKSKQKVGTISLNTNENTAGISSVHVSFLGDGKFPPITEITLQEKGKKIPQKFFRFELQNEYYKNTISFQVDFDQSEKIMTKKRTFDIFATLKGSESGSFIIQNGGIGGYWDVAPSFNLDSSDKIYYQ